MKPKSKIEKKVLAMSKKLSPIPEGCKQFAYNLFPLTAQYQKGIKYKKAGKVWCQKCGCIEKVSYKELAISLETTHTCHECGANLQLQHERIFVPTYEERDVVLFQTHKGWEVARVIKAIRYNMPDKPTEYITHELFQIWISAEGKEIICGLKYTRSPFSQNWNYESEFDIKFHNASTSSAYAFDDMFDITNCYVYPRINATKKLYRNGWSSHIVKNKRVNIAECMKALLTKPEMETLVKQGQYNIFCYLISGDANHVLYPQSLKICHRNNYIVKDATMYYDYLDGLSDLGLDLHNAHYVCPENLIEAHDKVMKRLRAKREKEEHEARVKEAQKMEKAYFKLKNKYFGVAFTDGLINVSVLKSVQEFLEEGDAMHHCVYEREYYLKKESLILSAKDNTGKRLETVEVNLKTYKIVQSRAVCNGTSSYHDEIINLVNQNMNLIRQCA